MAIIIIKHIFLPLKRCLSWVCLVWTLRKNKTNDLGSYFWLITQNKFCCKSLMLGHRVVSTDKASLEIMQPMISIDQLFQSLIWLCFYLLGPMSFINGLPFEFCCKRLANIGYVFDQGVNILKCDLNTILDFYPTMGIVPVDLFMYCSSLWTVVHQYFKYHNLGPTVMIKDYFIHDRYCKKKLHITNIEDLNILNGVSVLSQRLVPLILLLPKFYAVKCVGGFGNMLNPIMSSFSH